MYWLHDRCLVRAICNIVCLTDVTVMSHLTPEKCFQAFEEHGQTIAAKPAHSAKFKGNKYFQGRTGGIEADTLCRHLSRTAGP